MLVTLAFCQKDQDQAEGLAVWIRDLGGCKGHELLLGVDSGVTSQRNAIHCYFDQSFDKVTVLPIANPYNDDEHAWPRAANHAWSTLARHIDENKLAPYWLYIEPDSGPLSAGWIDAIEKSHIESKKQFTGAYVRGANGSADKMSGIGVYPGNLVQYAGIALIADEVAWDQAAASQIVPLANFTSLIFHKWKGLSFSSIEELREMIGPEPVLYHSDKTGRTIELLRAKMNLSGGVESRHAEPPCKHGDVSAEADLMPSARGLVQSNNDSGSSAPPAQNPSGPDLIRPVSSIIPWANKKESLDYIRWLATEARRFCTAPRSTLVVREEFKKARVITKIR